MENKNKSLITYAIFGIFLMVFGVYSSTINYAHAVSVITVTFSGGTTTNDVTYRTDTPDTDSTAYIVGAFGGIARVWKKSGSDQTIIGNVTLTSSTTARAIEYNEDIIAVYVATNDKFYKLTTNLGIGAQFASGTANIVRQLVYDEPNNDLYFCTDDGYGTLNQVTLTPTTLYSDPQTNGVLGCAVDPDGFMYLAGSNIGSGFTADIIKIDLDTHTQVDEATFAANFGFGVCYDDFRDKIWVTEPSGSIVHKYDNVLTQEATVATGTTPRFCSISFGEGGERLYVNNEGTDNVSIIDTFSNVVLSTQTVCDFGATTPKPDTKRLFNTTNTYITCPVTTNRVIIDDSVSEIITEPDPDSCDNPANANLLRCRLGEDGGIGGIGDSVGDGVLLLGCNIIFVDCTDENPQTNGLGLLVFIASIFVVIGMFYYSIGKDAFHMPIFIYIVIIVALSAFFTITGIIDPIFLILSIVAIIALASPKIISVVRGSTFGGGSTE